MNDQTPKIYSLSHPVTGEVRYIGKANDLKTRHLQHLREKRMKTPLYKWIDKLASEGLSPNINLVRICFDCDWEEAEKQEIAKARLTGIRLLNLSPGGKGAFPSSEQRTKAGKRLAEHVKQDDPVRQRITQLKRSIRRAINQGYVDDDVAAKLRLAAARNPKLFGEWANVQGEPGLTAKNANDPIYQRMLADYEERRRRDKEA